MAFILSASPALIEISTTRSEWRSRLESAAEITSRSTKRHCQGLEDVVDLCRIRPPRPGHFTESLESQIDEAINLLTLSDAIHVEIVAEIINTCTVISDAVAHIVRSFRDNADLFRGTGKVVRVNPLIIDWLPDVRVHIYELVKEVKEKEKYAHGAYGYVKHRYGPLMDLWRELRDIETHIRLVIKPMIP